MSESREPARVCASSLSIPLRIERDFPAAPTDQADARGLSRVDDLEAGTGLVTAAPASTSPVRRELAKQICRPDGRISDT
jgi:hypothetical protein